MKLRYFSTLTALCLLAFASPSAKAQEGNFTIRFQDTSAVIGVADLYKKFYVYIYNNTASEQQVTISRISNELPNGAWSSNICTDDMCYPADLNEIPPITLAPKGDKQRPDSVKMYLWINAGQTPNEQAKVALQFSMGPFNPVITQEFSLMLVTSSVLADNRPAVRVAPVPNPASTSTLLPADIVSTEGMSVRLYDPLGRLAADLTSSARLGNGGVTVSLDALAEGTYFYQLDANGYRGTGTLVVSR